MKLTLAITTYNRPELTMESFAKVYDHHLIDEVVIIDDASTEENWKLLIWMIEQLPNFRGKIFSYRNKENLGMSRNKAEAVRLAKNEWVILFDLDNELYPEYLDAVATQFAQNPFQYGLQKEIIYHPSFAEPEHDYTQWEGQFIGKLNAKDYLNKPEFRCMLNSCNYVVNRDEYLRVYKYDETIKESDTIHFNTLWLEAGNAFYVVPGMRYHHRKHKDSGWLKGDHRYNLKKAAKAQERIKNL